MFSARRSFTSALRSAGSQRRRPARAQPFELADDVEQLVHVGARERRDRQPRLLRARRADDESFLLQPLQRLAHRRATHAESRRDLRLHDAAAGREQALDDQIAQALVHLLRARAVRRVGREVVVG